MEQGRAEGKPIILTANCAATLKNTGRKPDFVVAWHIWCCQHLQANLAGHRAGMAQKEKREEGSLFEFGKRGRSLWFDHF